MTTFYMTAVWCIVLLHLLSGKGTLIIQMSSQALQTDSKHGSGSHHI